MLYITFPYLLLISMTAFAGALLNADQRFTIPALMPVFLNIALISAAMLGVHYFNQPIFVLAWGVVVGGVLQCAFPAIALYRRGQFPRFRWGASNAAVRRVLKQMVPALFGVSITSVFAAKFGAELAHYLSQSTLRKLMGAWFLVVSLILFLI